MNAKRLAIALLLGVVIAVFFDTLWGLGAAALPYVPRVVVGALEFIGVRYLKGRLVILALLFASFFGINRVWAKRNLDALEEWVFRAYARAVVRWRSLRRRWRAIIVGAPFVVGCLMLLSGMPLGAIALLAVRFPAVAGGIAWGGKAGVAWLAKKAGGRILDSRLQKAWKKVPAKPRTWVERHYRRLWFWTMFRIARGCRAYLHYVHRRMNDKVEACVFR